MPVAQNGMFILFLVFWYVQPVNQAFWAVVDGISGFVGVDPDFVARGYMEFQFWKQRPPGS